MTTNLRLALAIFSIGFAIDGAGDLVSFVTDGKFQPGLNLLFLLPTVTTLAGLLFVWIGRHEWSALHRDRVRQAHIVFGLSLVGAFVAGAVVALLVLRPSIGVPLWAKVAFGAAASSLILGTFVTYAYLVFHLVGRPSKAVLAGSIAWSLLISAFMGAALGRGLPAIVAIALARKPTLPAFITPVDSLASYLFLSYFLLLAVYAEAHQKIARGLPSSAPRAGRPVPPA